MERWMKIKGYENYSVSSEGRVRNDKRGRLLNGRCDRNGYMRVYIRAGSERKYMYVHRLVALHFIPNPDNLPQVNHLNEIKTDNRVENLEWCTAKYNMNYGTCVERGVKNRTGKTAQKQCIVDGIVYTSISLAEKELEIRKGCLTDALWRGRTLFKGHTISYL